MYYEERVIDGILHCRSTPDGEWTPLSKVALTERLLLAEAKLAHVAARMAA